MTDQGTLAERDAPPAVPGSGILRPAWADPAAWCAVHGRVYTYREQLAGACSWCVPERFVWREGA